MNKLGNYLEKTSKKNNLSNEEITYYNFWKQWLELPLGGKQQIRFHRGQKLIKDGHIVSPQINAGHLSIQIKNTRYIHFVASLDCSFIDSNKALELKELLSKEASLMGDLWHQKFPEDLETFFIKNKEQLLPYLEDLDLKCSCENEDKASFCAHIGALFYFWGNAFLQDPLLFLKFRGMPWEWNLNNSLIQKKESDSRSIERKKGTDPDWFKINLEGEEFTLGSPAKWSSNYHFPIEINKIYSVVSDKAGKKLESILDFD